MNGGNNASQYIGTPFPSSIASTTPSSAFKFVNQTLQLPPTAPSVPAPSTSALPSTTQHMKQQPQVTISNPINTSTGSQNLKFAPLPVNSVSIPQYTYNPFVYGALPFSTMYAPTPLSSSHSFPKSFSFANKTIPTSGSFQPVKSNPSTIENSSASKKLEVKEEDSKTIVNTEKVLNIARNTNTISNESHSSSNNIETNKVANSSTTTVTSNIKKEKQKPSNIASSSTSNEKSFVLEFFSLRFFVNNIFLEQNPRRSIPMLWQKKVEKKKRENLEFYGNKVNLRKK